MVDVCFVAPAGAVVLPVREPERKPEVPEDSKEVFDACWKRFELRYKLKEVHVPREVVWLNGAPGAGKVRCLQ